MGLRRECSGRFHGSSQPSAMAGSRLYGGPTASVKQIQVTFDCAEPERVARFWCQVLGYLVPPPPEGFATWDDFDRALPPERLALTPDGGHGVMRLEVPPRSGWSVASRR